MRYYKFMALPLIQKLSRAQDVNLAGGKAVSLGKLLRAGFPSLDGFVVTTQAFNSMDRMLENKILKEYDSLKTKYVAVRSSATSEDGKNDAWAGQLDTYLSIGRQELISAIRRCWEAVNSERAKSYAKQKNIKAGKVAIIVQPMVQSKVAGVAFSVHPVTKNPDHIIIEAGFGLGESVVSGEVTPDTYIVSKESGGILQKHIANQAKKLVQGTSGANEWQQIEHGNTQKLPDNLIKELAEHVKKIESYYGFPVDTEWMLLDKLYIMQSRPITTL